MNPSRLLSHSYKNRVLHELDIDKIVKQLKSGEAAGGITAEHINDGITAEHIKYGGPAVIKWLHKILRQILLLDDVPSCMKEGIITPIYKGKRRDP